MTQTSLSTNTAGTTGHTHAKKDESRHRLYTLNKSELKMDHRPDSKCETTKLLGLNIWRKPFDTDLRHDFLDIIPKA